MSTVKKAGKNTGLPRFFDPPDGSFFLFGPRGTGKSTWLGTALPGALRVDLLDPGVEHAYRTRPERLLEVVRAIEAPCEVVVDEVQKVPELLDAVHLLMEEEKGRRFVLTGSSARKLRGGGVNLLAGRAVEATMHPFMAAELPQFDVDSALEIGMLPLVRASATPLETLRSYLGLYVREEVQAEGLVRNLTSFSRFMEALSFSHANALNLTEVARECGVSRSTVVGYLAVMEDLLLSRRLPVFQRRAKRQLTKHPKFYWFDAGVFAQARPRGPMDAPEEVLGAALEGLVEQHLRAWIGYRRRGETLHYWRTRSGVEVDFVVYGPSTFVAIDVMRSARVRPRDLRSLRVFREDYPEAGTVLLYGGRETLLTDDVLCVPYDDYLAALKPTDELRSS